MAKSARHLPRLDSIWLGLWDIKRPYNSRSVDIRAKKEERTLTTRTWQTRWKNRISKAVWIKKVIPRVEE